MKLRSRRSFQARVALVVRDGIRRSRVRLIAAAALVGLLLGGGSLGFALNQEPAPEPTGLQGVWPNFPPPSLAVSVFNRLDENWAKWSEEAAIDVANLYTVDEVPLEEQRRALEKVESRVRVLEKALRDSKYAMIREEMASIHAPLKLRAQLFRNGLELMEVDAAPAARAELPRSSSRFGNAFRDARSDLDRVPNGQAWYPFLRIEEIGGKSPEQLDIVTLEALERHLDPAAEGLNDEQRKFLRRGRLQEWRRATRELVAMKRIAESGIDRALLREKLADVIKTIELHEDSPVAESAARIRAANNELRLVAGPSAKPLQDLVRSTFMNYNFRLVADAEFIGKMTSVDQIDSGPVRDYFMGAQIYGNQTTQTSARMKFIPSSDQARFEVQLVGVSNSQTNAYTSQATVSSVGQHEFYATKPLAFDGDRFSFQPAHVSVNPNIRHTGIATKYDHLFFGLFKGMIRRRAMGEANARLPQGRAHAADELSSQLLPEFNGEVERNFGELNNEIAKLDQRLASENLAPSAERVRTTGDRFLFDAAIRGGDELSGSAPNIGSTRGVGFTLQVHQSLLNNMADRWGLGGQSMTEAQVREHLEGWFTRILGREVSFADESGNPADPSILIFDEKDPIRFEINQGALRLILRAGLKTEDDRDIPTQVVEVPLELSVSGGKIHIKRGTVIVSPLDPPRNRALQITRARIMGKRIEDSIQDGSVEANHTVTPEGRNPISLSIQRIDAQAGWLTIFGN